MGPIKILLILLSLLFNITNACLVFHGIYYFTSSQNIEAYLVDNGIQVCQIVWKVGDLEHLPMSCIEGYAAWILDDLNIVAYNAQGRDMMFSTEYYYADWWTIALYYANNYGCNCHGYKCSIPN